MELEEGAIQLPAGSSELPVPPSPVKTIHHDILYDMAGTFYGRRDFENRPDSDDDQYKLKRQTTAVGAVLERIMSSRRRESVSEDSASGEDDDDDDDDDDDADDETN
jgi:hypothetical protein